MSEKELEQLRKLADKTYEKADAIPIYSTENLVQKWRYACLTEHQLRLELEKKLKDAEAQP